MRAAREDLLNWFRREGHLKGYEWLANQLLPADAETVDAAPEITLMSIVCHRTGLEPPEWKKLSTLEQIKWMELAVEAVSKNQADTTAVRKRPGRRKNEKIAKRNRRIEQLCVRANLFGKWAMLAEKANADDETQALNLGYEVTRDIARDAMCPPKGRRN